MLATNAMSCTLPRLMIKCTAFCCPCSTHLQGEVEVVLTQEGQQVHATVRPASPELAAAVAPGAGQALEVQLPHRIMLVRDTGGSSAQLVNAEVDGERVALQVLSRGPRHLRLQHCGAQRLVALDAPLAAELTRYMPAPTTEDFSKVGEGRGGGRWRDGWVLPGQQRRACGFWSVPVARVPNLLHPSLLHPALRCHLQVIQSPMPGTLVHLAVEAGQEVNPGDEVRAAQGGSEGIHLPRSLDKPVSAGLAVGS